MDFFENVEMAPPDAILGLNKAFADDKRVEKVNLGVGAYKTADLKPLVLESVKAAEKILLEKELNKEYLPITGEPAFVEEIKKLVLGDTAASDSLFAVQTIGGTGALRIGSELLYKFFSKLAFISDPTWDNHRRILAHTGFEVETYPYYDKKKHGFDFERFSAFLKEVPKRSVLILQVSCHNPTGCDPSFEEFQEIEKIVKERELIPFFDVAYQGLGDGLEEDVKALRYFVEKGHTLLIATSYSKNFGLYAERVGALVVASQNSKGASILESQLKVIIRGIYSNPPIHGARIVSTILQDPKLKAIWEKELETMRFRIKEMRKSLISHLQAKGLKYHFMSKQTGMFSYTGLEQDQVERLTSIYGIYLPKDGRINIAGLNSKNLSYVVEAIANVST